ncbi:MAG: glycosyltransferase [Candidatus Pacebacteria bacterium]|nr:glycosyltransferase [Candidatus Paceibacterota bacterium]
MKEKTSENHGQTEKQNKRPEKILFVITKSNFGGAQRYVFELATRLSKEGNKVAVALGGAGVLKTKLEEAGIEIFPISSAQRDISVTKEIKVLWRLYSIVRIYKPTIVHLNSPKIGGLGAVATRIGSFINNMFGKGSFVKKIIYTNHGWPFNEPRPEWQQITIRIFSWLTVFVGGTTIVLSETERNDVKSWPFVQKKFSIITNGVATFNLLHKKEALTTLVGEVKAEQWLNEGRTIIGTISELHKNKGLIFALEGLNSYIEQYPEQKIAYVIIGEGEMRSEIETLIRNLSSLKPEQIILAGHVNEAREYLQAFDLFLLSSVKEGLPFALLEAGYAGIPVISTSVGGIPEVIQNLENGILIAPRRPQEIKNALVYLNEHPEVKEQMVKKFKEKINQKYNFELIVADIKKLYEIK